MSELSEEFEVEFNTIKAESPEEILSRKTPKKGKGLKNSEINHVLSVTQEMAQSAVGRSEMEMLEMREKVNAMRRLYRMHQLANHNPIDLLFSPGNYAKWASDPNSYNLSEQRAVEFEPPNVEKIAQQKESIFDMFGL